MLDKYVHDLLIGHANPRLCCNNWYLVKKKVLLEYDPVTKKNKFGFKA